MTFTGLIFKKNIKKIILKTLETKTYTNLHNMHSKNILHSPKKKCIL